MGTQVHPEGGFGRDTQGCGEGERREKLGVAFREKLAEDPMLIAGDNMGLSDEDEDETVGIIQSEGGVRPTSEVDVKLAAGDSTAGWVFL